MKRILVRIKAPRGDTAREMTIPTDLALADFLPAIAKRLGLLTEQTGRPIQYQLIHDGTGRRFNQSDCLGASIVTNDLLTIRLIE